MSVTFKTVPPELSQPEFNAERQAFCNRLNAITSTGVGAGDYTYLIRKNGAVYEAYDSTSSLIFGGSGNAGGATGTSGYAVAAAALAAMTTGGRLHLACDLNLGTNELTVTLTKDTGLFMITGEGKSKSKFTFTGTGHALRIVTADVAPGYYYFALKDFQIDCVSKTSGRSGLYLAVMGRIGVIDHLDIKNVDSGVVLTDCNVMRLSNVRVDVANNGYILNSTGGSETNECTFINCDAIWTDVIGVDVQGGDSNHWFGGSIAPHAGIGMQFYGTHGASVNGVHFEGEAAFTTFVFLTGSSSSFPCVNICLNECYFDAHGYAEYNVKILYALKTKIDSPVGYAGGTATAGSIYLANEQQELTLINPDFYETYLLGSDPGSMLTSRLAGTVIEAKRTGLIVKAGETVAVNDLVKWTTGGVVVKTTGLDENCVSSVMYPQVSGQPIVIVSSGVSQVKVDAAATGIYTLVSSDTAGQAFCDNSVTISKKVLGYSLETSGGAGTVWYLKAGG